MRFSALSNVHVGLAGAKRHSSGKAVKRADCSTGIVTSPTAGQVVSTTGPTTFTWDTTCISKPPKYIDLYLFAPGNSKSLIQAFDSAEYAHGSFEVSSAFDVVMCT